MARVLTMYIGVLTMSRGQYGNFSTVTVLPSPQGLVSKPLKVVFMPLNTCILSKPLKAYKSIKQPCGRSRPLTRASDQDFLGRPRGRPCGRMAQAGGLGFVGFC